MIPYELVRSSRKTLSLQITPEGKVLVRAPNRCPKSYIDDFIRQKEQWILTHQRQAEAALENRDAFSLQEGSSLMFCGKPLTLHFTGGTRCTLDLEERTLTVPEKSVAELRLTVRNLYRRGGLPWVQRRLDSWSKTMGISYRSVSMSTAQRRWGSCSSRGDIHISWLLLFAPERAIDYVLVHELCHRREFNHSPAFWAMVETYIPDYREQKQVLRALQTKLFSQGWSE